MREVPESHIKVDLSEIPHYPAIESWFQAVYIYEDEETQKKNWMASPREFESMTACKDWIAKHKCVLGHGEVEWEIMLIEKSIIPID
tara:strand:- start:96 stop:356 length:261 start_codon:yes stop_codon:yes gene_type:complete